jgi:copper transport protein
MAAGAGVYRLDGVSLPVPGRWTVRVAALVSDFARVTFEAAIPVP